MIAFYSSDARKLFKEDVFRTLSYPTNYIVHFRYKKTDVNLDLVNRKLIGKDGIIIYCHNNNISLNPEKREVINVPLRTVEIVEFYKSQNNDLIHFYLKLKEFVTIEKIISEKIEMAPFTFLNEIGVIGQKEVIWKEKVNEFSEYFPDQLFYSFNINKKALFQRLFKQKIYPKFSNNEYECYYELKEESDYVFTISFYDIVSNEEKQTKVQVERRNDLFTTSCPEEIFSHAKQDDRNFKLLTHTIQLRRRIDYIKFSNYTELKENGKNLVDPITTNIRLDIIKTPIKSLLFSVFALATICSIPVISRAFETLINPCQTSSILLLITGVAMALGGTFGMFFFFNKK